MELRHLRYFVAVAEMLHFSRAAAHLRIAQPTLSQQIGRLEAELQTKLLQRTKRTVQLTEAGRQFLASARGILAEADRAVVAARRVSVADAGSLRAGCAPWIDADTVIRAVAHFRRRHPAVHIDLRILSTHQQEDALRNRRLDVGLLRPPVADSGLSTETVTLEPFKAALPAAHRWSRRSHMALSALADEPFVMLAAALAPNFYGVALKACREAGFVPHVAHEVDHAGMVLALVATGAGVSLVPDSASRARTRGVCFRSLSPPPRVVLRTAVAWRAADRSPLVASFVEAVRETASARRPARAISSSG